MLTLTCPHCGHQLQIPDKYAGQTGSCTKCQGQITVPPMAQPTPDLAPPKADGLAGLDPSSLERININPDKPLPPPVLGAASVGGSAAPASPGGGDAGGPSALGAWWSSLNSSQKAGCSCCLIFVTMVFMCAGGCQLLIMNSPEPAEHSSSMAYVMSQHFVEQRLVSPGTAKFPWGAPSATDMGNGVYQIRAYCDSQNRLGATIRTNYTCTMKYIGNGKWECSDLNLTER